MSQRGSNRPHPAFGHAGGEGSHGIDHKAASIPELVGEVAVGFHLFQAQVGVFAGGGAHQQGETQRVGAKVIHDVDWVDHIALGFGHFLAVLIAHQAMQVDGVEGGLLGELEAAHNHARHPEKQDVVAGLHVGGRVEVFQVGGLFGPTEGREGPQAGGEPGIEHIRVLFDPG